MRRCGSFRDIGCRTRSGLQRRGELSRVRDRLSTNEILTDVGKGAAILRLSRLDQWREIGQAPGGVRESDDAIQTGARENGFTEGFEVGAARFAGKHDLPGKIGVIVERAQQ